MRYDDKRQTCMCGHRYGDHAKNGGPCLAADTPPHQRTGQGCQCHKWEPLRAAPPLHDPTGPAEQPQKDPGPIPGEPR